MSVPSCLPCVRRPPHSPRMLRALHGCGAGMSSASASSAARRFVHGARGSSSVWGSAVLPTTGIRMMAPRTLLSRAGGSGCSSRAGASRSWLLRRRNLGNSGASPAIATATANAAAAGRNAASKLSLLLSGGVASGVAVAVAGWAHSHRAVCAAAVAPRDAREPATPKAREEKGPSSLDGSTDLDLSELLELLWPDMIPLTLAIASAIGAAVVNVKLTKVLGDVSAHLWPAAPLAINPLVDEKLRAG